MQQDKKTTYDVLVAIPRATQSGQQQKSDYYNIGTVWESDKSQEGARVFSGQSVHGRLLVTPRQERNGNSAQTPDQQSDQTPSQSMDR